VSDRPDGSGVRSKWTRATRAIHPPELPPQQGVSVAPQLDLSSTYAFADTEDFARASRDKIGAGYVYTRWANPTIDAFEAAVADLESMGDAEGFASGMAAISAIFLGLCSAGDRAVVARQLYGGVHSLVTEILPRYNIRVDLVDVDDFERLNGALPGARLLYCETIGNPAVRLADLDELGRLASAHHVAFVVDNTFASPLLCRPVEHGATIVVHSATKFLGGHHDLIGGIVCANPGRLEAIRSLARDLGPTMAPFNAWLVLRGLQTLPLRVEASSNSALEIAEFLDHRPDVANVFYPALSTSVHKDRAERILGGRGGGTLAFDVTGGRERAAAFQERLELIDRAASLGGTHTLIVHAASVTHTQLGPDELIAAGISEGFCRLSVGLEDPRDLIRDLERALDSTPT
jgi:cystathionine beta-lyase/cystathionine gamma-synthase